MIDYVADVVDPDGVDSGRGHGRIAARWAYGIGVAGAALLISGVVNIWFAGPTTRAEKATEKRIEDTEQKNTPAFTARIKQEDPGDFPLYVLDRPLSETEKKKLHLLVGGNRHSLAEPRAAQRYLRRLGAVTDSRSTAYSIALFSERKSVLSITDMHAKIIKCRKPQAVTIIDFISQGNSGVSSVYFDLAEVNGPARVSDVDGGRRGEPYFTSMKIDLGEGEAPGALRVSAESYKETCEWVIVAEYRNSQGVFKAEIKNSNNKPFVAVGIPKNYKEWWTRIPYEGGYWQICNPAEKCTGGPNR
ncbi:hypothetical protein [Streptomyces sp. W007]|uniref:hypothetical protein n=1 Tax=Streptomyces sp. W007 TaxID=1055352 RepID=UPI001112A8B7|nr:hypothetical protein [Streptomyces sp. W007]